MSYQYPFIPGHSSMPSTPQTTFHGYEGDHQQQQQQQLEQQVLQHPLQRQPEQNQDVYATSSTTTVQIQDQVPTVPSQNPRSRPGSSGRVEGVHDEPHMRLQHMSVPALLQPEHMRPPMIDTRRVYHTGKSMSPSSGPPSAGPSGTFHHGAIGPVRARVSPVLPDPRAASHPYRRPQSVAGVVIAKSRREPEDSVRYSRQASSSGASYMPAPLSATTPTTATTPGALVPSVKMMSTVKGLVNPGYSSNTDVNIVIRTDLHFDSETSILTALCELPGRSKSDVSVVLSTNAMNRVKQVVVTAKAPQGLSNDGYVLRERRSGSVSRTFVVPSETTTDDVTVEMHNGLLSLKIQCPPPSLEDDAQEIVIR